jgi:hypothetical protein
MSWTLGTTTAVSIDNDKLITCGGGGPYATQEDCQSQFDRLWQSNPNWQNGSVEILEVYCINDDGRRLEIPLPPH